MDLLNVFSDTATLIKLLVFAIGGGLIGLFVGRRMGRPK
jgi:hypothetical protein